MEDFEIVELFLKRDENAIAETEKKYGGKLFKLAFSILSDRQFAEECVNDACMKAWQSIPPNEPYGYLLPYLLKITRSISLNRAKSMSAVKRNAALSELTREMEECIPSSFDTAGEAEANELKECINSFLAALNRQKRDIFVRRYWYCDEVLQIAERFGIGQSKVKMTLLRTRQALRAYLEEKDLIDRKGEDNGRN